MDGGARVIGGDGGIVAAAFTAAMALGASPVSIAAMASWAR